MEKKFGKTSRTKAAEKQKAKEQRTDFNVTEKPSKKKREKNAPDRPQPAWLFPPDNENPALNPKSKSEEQIEKETKQRLASLSYLEHRSVTAPVKPPPPGLLLQLVHAFLTSYGFVSSSRTFTLERNARKVIDGWDDEIGKKLDKGMPDLVRIFNAWHDEWKLQKNDETSSDESESDSDSDSEDAQEIEDTSDDDSSDDSASEDSDRPKKEIRKEKKASKSGIDAAMKDEPPKAQPTVQGLIGNLSKNKPLAAAAKAIKEATSSDETSSDDSDSSSGSDSEDEKAPTKKETANSSTTNGTLKAPSTNGISKASAVNGKSSAQDSSSSDSSSDSSSESDSNDKKPNGVSLTSKKATENKVEEEATSSDSSDSDSSSDESLPDSRKRRRKSPAQQEMNGTKFAKKSNAPFQRISANTKVDPRFSSNAYVPYDYADRAFQDLSVTRGKGFTKEKNKKKRGAYRGGYIDVNAGRGIKFED